MLDVKQRWPSIHSRHSVTYVTWQHTHQIAIHL